MSVRRVLLAALVLLAGGAAGAMAGGWWGWRSPASMPPDAVLAQVTGPGATVTDRVDGVFGWDPPVVGWRDQVVVWTTGDDGYEAGQVELTRRVPDAPAALREAAAGVAAAGWRTQRITGDQYGERFWALRDGVTVEVESSTESGEERQLSYTFRRSPPDAVRWAMPLGWLAGAVVALLLLWPAARLFRRSASARIPAWVGLGVLLPATLLTTLAVVPAAFPQIDNEREIPTPPWFAFTMFGVRPLALGGLALLLAALVVAVVAAVSRPAPGVRREP